MSHCNGVAATTASLSSTTSDRILDAAFDRIVARKSRRRMARRLEAASLVVVVLAATVAGAYGVSMRWPRSPRSQARARASCTASSAAARLPDIKARAATRRAYLVARNSRIEVSSSRGSFCLSF